jgi:hypothetical protein
MDKTDILNMWVLANDPPGLNPETLAHEITEIEPPQIKETEQRNSAGKP